MAEEPNPDIENAEDELVLDAPLDADAPPPEGDDEGEEVPTFGDDVTAPQDADSGLVKHLRQVAREAMKRAADAEARTAPQRKVEVGPKPTLWDDGIEGDEDKYDTAMETWRSNKAAADGQRTAADQSAEEGRKQIEARLEKLEREKTALARPDTDDAFETARAALGEAKFIGIAQILDEGTDAARFFYALGQNPKELQAIASQSDPVRLVKEIAKLEGQLKMTRRKAPIDPDTPERGSGKISKTGADKKLEKLEAEADRTNDRTAVIAYKRKLREAASK